MLEQGNGLAQAHAGAVIAYVLESISFPALPGLLSVWRCGPGLDLVVGKAHGRYSNERARGCKEAG